MIFIPQFGAAGAALGTLVAEFVVLVYQVILMKDACKVIFTGVKYYVLIIATIIAGVCCIFVKQLSLGVFFALLVSAVIFFGVYFIVLIIGKEYVVKEILQVVFEKLKKK